VLLLLLLLLLLLPCLNAENGPADLSQNRYIYIRKLPRDEGFRTEYAWGPSIKYSIAKNHTLPNGQKMPLWAKLETPQVRYSLNPQTLGPSVGHCASMSCWQCHCQQCSRCILRAAATEEPSNKLWLPLKICC
jgi:hypothetical protein